MTAQCLAFNVEPSHRRYRLRLARYKALAEAIRDFLVESDDSHNARLLDVGAGQGRTLSYLQEEGVAHRVAFFGIDMSERRLAAIHEPHRWSLQLGDITRGLPYAADEFDICVCEQVLEHLDSPQAVIAEMTRVLRSGGLMVVGVPVFPPGIAHLRAISAALMSRLFGVKREHAQTFTCGSFIRLMTRDRTLSLVKCRGFRVLSGGPLSPLEDCLWWYQFNRWLGRHVPWLCTEVQLVLRKQPADPAAPAQSV